MSSHTHGVIDPKHQHLTGVGVETGMELFGNDGTFVGWRTTHDNYSVTTSTADGKVGRKAYTSQQITGISVAAAGAGTPAGAVGTTIASSGTSGTGQNLPPYYALCFIMKT